MALSATLIPEFDQEMATSRIVVERVPEDKYGWKPHEKSMTAGRLASHVAEIPTWASATVDHDFWISQLALHHLRAVRLPKF